MAIGTRPSSRTLRRGSGSHPGASCAKTSSKRLSRSFFGPASRSPTNRSLSTPGVRDVERGLSLDLRVVVYTNDKKTKEFLEREALRLAPGLKRKSGARYRLNRWREDRVANGVKITYRDLVREYVRLSQTAGPFAQFPTGDTSNSCATSWLRRPRCHKRAAIGPGQREDDGCAEGLSILEEVRSSKAKQ